MPGTHVAFLRGINVGRAKRVAMADLRAVAEDLGYTDIKTVLNSGNLVFSAPGVSTDAAAAAIEAAVLSRTGVSSRVTVVEAAELADVVAENPLSAVADDPSRLLVGVLPGLADAAKLEPLLDRDWAPGAIAVRGRAAYFWCPEGVLKSPALDAATRVLGDAITTRNWSTITKLHALVAG